MRVDGEGVAGMEANDKEMVGMEADGVVVVVGVGTDGGRVVKCELLMERWRDWSLWWYNLWCES